MVFKLLYNYLSDVDLSLNLKLILPIKTQCVFHPATGLWLVLD